MKPLGTGARPALALAKAAAAFLLVNLGAG
jgi:hypothetical protein